MLTIKQLAGGAALVIGCALGAFLTSLGFEGAKADPAAAASQQNQPTAIAHLAQANPDLRADKAVIELNDTGGEIYRTDGANDTICLIELPNHDSENPAIVESRFVCGRSSDAAEQGVIGGVPGHWFGIATDPSTPVSTHMSDGTERQVERNTTGVFRVPTGAVSVTVGQHTHQLPTSR